MTRECQNCGSQVSQQYVRVFAPDETEGVRVCPSCKDKIRDGRDVRDAITPRSTQTKPSRYDPAYAADGGDA